MPATSPNAYKEFLDPRRIAEVAEFIHARWGETVRFSPRDDGTLLGLPHPYTIPCRNGAFQELYYWDTYFTCVGLIASGRLDLARDNARNLLAQVERFGFVPNGNRTYYLSRSQPPYLAPLVKLVADVTGDEAFFHDAVPLIEREYLFWTTRRLTPTGLSHHGHHASPDELVEFFPTVKYRLGKPDARAEDSLDLAFRAMAECETGWDFNSRFDKHCAHFCAVELNSSLYLYETMLAECPAVADRARWQERARVRRERMNTFCWDAGRGGFFDYDHVRQERSRVVSAAALQTLWTGLADEAQAAALVRNYLPQLEYDFGVSAVETEGRVSPYQWDYPNGWPPMQFLVYRGLERYGYHEDARRVAEKYLATVCRSFTESGDLWEKYNVLDGTHHTVGEAGYLLNPTNAAESPEIGITEVPPAMMGWTAGVFLDAAAFVSGAI